MTYSEECNSGQLLGKRTEFEEVAYPREIVAYPIQDFRIGAERADQLDVDCSPKPGEQGANPSQPGVYGTVVRGAEEDDAMRAVENGAVLDTRLAESLVMT